MVGYWQCNIIALVNKARVVLPNSEIRKPFKSGSKSSNNLLREKLQKHECQKAGNASSILKRVERQQAKGCTSIDIRLLYSCSHSVEGDTVSQCSE